MPTPKVRFSKRLLDLAVSAAGLFLLLPVLAAIALAVKLDSRGPVIFSQERIGLGRRPFWIFKFRTMVADAPHLGGAITAGGDPRITRVGRVLRKLKLDELPQLVNVLRGDMSLVGPRPEVARYVDLFERDYEQILQVPPGLTDMASLKYRDEESALAAAGDAEREYVTRILPDKIALAKQYVQRSSLTFDLSLIMKTIFQVAAGSAHPIPGRTMDGKG